MIMSLIVYHHLGCSFSIGNYKKTDSVIKGARLCCKVAHAQEIYQELNYVCSVRRDRNMKLCAMNGKLLQFSPASTI